MWEKQTTDTGQSYDTVSELPRPAHRRNRDTSDGSDCGSPCFAFASPVVCYSGCSCGGCVVCSSGCSCGGWLASCRTPRSWLAAQAEWAAQSVGQAAVQQQESFRVTRLFIFARGERSRERQQALRACMVSLIEKGAFCALFPPLAPLLSPFTCLKGKKGGCVSGGYAAARVRRRVEDSCAPCCHCEAPTLSHPVPARGPRGLPVAGVARPQSRARMRP